MSNLKELGMALHVYADEHAGQYPPAQHWCDALAAENGDEVDFNDVFRCPQDETGPCSYAMNPYADPNSDDDTVLLFESKPGWNQYGGSELFMASSHDKGGGHALRADG